MIRFIKREREEKKKRRGKVRWILNELETLFFKLEKFNKISTSCTLAVPQKYRGFGCLEFNQNRLSRFSFETDICTHTYIIYIYVYRERQQSGYKCYSWRRITRKGQNFELSPTRMNINFPKRFFSLFFSSPREEEGPLKSVAFLSNPIADVSPPSPLSHSRIFSRPRFDH